MKILQTNKKKKIFIQFKKKYNEICKEEIEGKRNYLESIFTQNYHLLFHVFDKLAEQEKKLKKYEGQTKSLLYSFVQIF